MKVTKQSLIMLIMVILFSTYPFPAVGQATGTQWATPLLKKWTLNGMLPVGPDSSVIPDKQMTRGQFIALINKTFNYSDQRSDLFVDVSEDAWYREDAAKAAAAGYITGYKNSRGEIELRAEQVLNRQEAAVILSRLFELRDGDKQLVQKFSDYKSIGQYAVQDIAYLVHANYVSGYPDHTFKPLRKVNIAEAVKMLDNLAGEIIAVKGIHNGTYLGNLVVNTSDVTLKNVVVMGNLYITAGAGTGSGNVVLDQVTVKGKTYVNSDGDVRINVHGKSSIPKVELHSGAVLVVEEGKDGRFEEIVLSANDLNVNVTENTRIEKLTITKQAGGAAVHLEKGATVSELTVNAEVNVSGQGKIAAASIQSDNVKLEHIPAKLRMDSGLTVHITGQNMAESVGEELDLTVQQKEVNAALEALFIRYSEELTKLNLPTEGLNGSSITWSTSDASVIATDGTINRPIKGQSDETVILTAVISKETAIATKTFTVTVRAKEESDLLSFSINGYEAMLTDETNHIRILVNKDASMNNLLLQFTTTGSKLMMGTTELQSGNKYAFDAEQDLVLLSAGNKQMSYRVSIVKVDHVVSTGLPTVMINTTNGAPVVDKENKLDASMVIMDGSTTTYGQGLYSGPLTIKGRGNSSWKFPKKSYAISPAKDAAMLDMPEDDDWVLIANYTDKSMMRNYIAYELGRSLNMAYSPKMRFVELYLNGEYLGNYILGEKIKISKDRLDINKLSNKDNTGSAMTGGYLIEKDLVSRLDPDDIYFTTDKIPSNGIFNIKGPKSSKITADQKAYITDYFKQAEAALYGDDFKDPEKGYQKYFDTASLIDWYIVNELYRNADANFNTSCYLFKDKDGKIHFGPLWDFDIGAGNANFNQLDSPVGFHVKKGPWIAKFFEDPAFVQKLNERWDELKDKQIPDMFKLIRNTENSLQLSANENFKKWDILGQAVWQNTNFPENRKTYSSEVNYLVDWLEQRVEWLNESIPKL